MALLPWLRLLKLLAVVAYATGTLGGVVARELPERRRLALMLAGPGMVASWLLGFVVAGVEGISYLSSFILWALFASFVSLNALLYSVGREGRRGPISLSLTLLGFFATLALMVFKPV
jgi:hypothetical protein